MKRSRYKVSTWCVREVEKQAFLSLERDILGMPVLVMEYKYGNQYIPGWRRPGKLWWNYIRKETAMLSIRSAGIRKWEQLQARQLVALGIRNDYGRVFPFAGSYCDDLED